MNNPKIISLGEVLWDLFPDGERFGGAPANFACHAAILGANVTMVSAVGDDRRGQEAIDTLERHGIDISLMQTVREVPTGSVGVALDKNGKPTFTIHEDCAWDRIAWSEEIAERVASADAVYFGTLGQRADVARNTIRNALKAAEVASVPRILDINLRAPFFDSDLIRESIQIATILKLSDEELGEVCTALGIKATNDTETTLRELLITGSLEQVVLTCGSDGAMLVTSNSVVKQAGIPVSVVDTVGAGDSFMASYLVGELNGLPPDQNLRKACEVAAETCTRVGAVPAQTE